MRKTVLSRIKPGKEERAGVLRAVDVFLLELQAALSLERARVQIVLGGSTAKGTWLSGDHDVDIFVRFPASYKDDELSEVLEKAMARLPDAENVLRVHGSRDYFQVTRGTIMFEVVPVQKISNPKYANNVTDMSPLHVKYVTEQIDFLYGKSAQKIRDEIRLTKQFCKAQRVYGAESYVNGFSGHVVDLLVLTYGGFRRLLKEVADWPEGMLVLDPSGKNADPLKLIDSSKFGPLVLVDPVQPGRNAAAALSVEQYIRFKHAAQKFLKKPSAAMFIRTILTPMRAKQKVKNYRERSIVYTAQALQGSDDVAGTKLWKAHQQLMKCVRAEGFTVQKEDWEYDKQTRTATSYVVVKEVRLPATYEREGPPIKEKRDAARFKNKHKTMKNKVVEKDGRLYATIKQKRRTLKAVTEHTLKEPYFSKRCAGTCLR